MPIFESSANDPLGLWELAPQTVSFGMGEDETAAPPAEGTIYKLNLPADATSARQAMLGQEAALETAGAALQGIPTRLADVAAQMQQRQQTQPGSPSFDAAALTPEAELLLALAEIERGPGGEVSFGLGEDLGAAFEAAKAQFEKLMAQLDRDFLHFAWVETSISNRLIARTSVDWSGDSNTTWAENIASEQVAMHQRALSIASQTRNLRLRMFVTVAGGTAKVAGLMTTPAGAVLALPVMYQYVSNILKQAKELQSIPTP